MHNIPYERVEEVIAKFLEGLTKLKQGPMSGVAGITQYLPGDTLQELKESAHDATCLVTPSSQYNAKHQQLLPSNFKREATRKLNKILKVKT